VDPNPAAVDDEYTVYRITLKNGTRHEVRIPARTLQTVVVQEFRKTGYTGDVPALMKMAVEEPRAVPDTAGEVRGMSITDIQNALAEVMAEAVKLQAAVASLR
jgi:hypothetical protein